MSSTESLLQWWQSRAWSRSVPALVVDMEPRPRSQSRLRSRAILKDAPILILDEPTANLDAIAEREILRSLDALMGRRTTLIITHRLVELEDMDNILVLDGGRIVDQSRHHDLLMLGRSYRRMLGAAVHDRAPSPLQPRAKKLSHRARRACGCPLYCPSPIPPITPP